MARQGWAAALLAPLAMTAACAPGAAAGPVVAIDAGRLSGEAAGRGAIFRGVPYARPPVGALRWRPPEPIPAWRGVREATRNAPACPQILYGDWNRAAAERNSEDCLYLDVRTPDLRPARPLPVMVWIHGGGNRAGSGAGPVESTLAGRGVVLVSIQYRLGVLGFLSHPALTAEAEDRSSGNYALLDQQAALRWVRANIARFGGDPGNVTIFGESAGAQDVGLQRLSPAAAGLFHKAIEESGTAGFGLPPRTLAENEALGEAIAAGAGAPADASAADLRRLPVRALLAAAEAADAPGLGDDSFIWLQAIIDGQVLPAAPATLLAAGRFQAVPLIIGVNIRELGLPGGLTSARATVLAAFGANAPAALRLYGLDRGAPPSDDPQLGDVALQVATDVTFRCPAITVSKAQARAGQPVWQYQYGFVGPDGAAVSHAAELRYVFPGRTARAGDPPLAEYWTNFAKSGDPNRPGLPMWPRYDLSARRYLAFEPRGPVASARLREPICGLRDRP